MDTGVEYVEVVREFFCFFCILLSIAVYPLLHHVDKRHEDGVGVSILNMDETDIGFET